MSDDRPRALMIQVAGAVWALAAPHRDVPSSALCVLVDRILAGPPAPDSDGVIVAAPPVYVGHSYTTQEPT